ncbi:helix-turn-helix transcriptional regulator [Priestia aryabhattai]|uniref:AimR family lysis-lysogeny pheromone receptor n=1 Tax=Priestia aryabhattai TaxID=412384 RepID=UPI001ED0CC52|nr:AimR family lysis-lysogeny pheromone receptor [Priestia aryabhattai]MBY0094917.1 helix-turn-helix transcriptional regulator [Priestia aryabhattai]MBY0105595.1 helix-turn-helix transcriptional regulator [Priestia aryabhattai]
MREILKAEMKKCNQADVANKLKTTSPTITRFLNGTQETSLSTSLKLIRYLAKDNEKKFMLELIKEIEKPANVIIAMEYASTNYMVKTLKYLLKKFSDTSNHELKEYLGIYELIYNWQLRHDGVPVDEQIKKARKLKVTTTEGNIMIKMLEVYGYFNSAKYNLAYDLAKDLQELVNEMDNEYMKMSITARLSETQSLLALILHNDVEQARQYATATINSKIGKGATAFSHYVLGASYFYEDYEKSKMHYEKAIKIYNKFSETNSNEVRKELEFVSAYHLVTGYDYKNEVAKAYSLQNAQNGSDSILKDLNINTLSGLEMMFVGELNQDEQMLMQAFTKFIQEKDMFNANHVKKTLEGMNVNTMILDNLMSLFA